MANTNSNLPGIKNSWSFIEFARMKGKPYVTKPREFVNSQTGETFTSTSVAFEHPTKLTPDGKHEVCFVGFSSNLGELSASEVAARKDELNVVQFENGNYSLCERGSNSWDAIDLGITF